MSVDDAKAEVPVSQKFDTAQALHESLQNGGLASSDPEYQKQVQTALLSFMAVNKSCSQQGTFSDNEELADIKTADLKFLITPYYIADLLLAVAGTDNRLRKVTSAISSLREYLDQCETFKLMTRAQAALYNLVP